MLTECEEKISIPVHKRQRCEIWTRVMGYQRPVSTFNIGKKGEYYERKFFLECNASLEE
ncbi:MAG: hypothetical protein KR126chlam3_00842 [Chlamydiae bacterium]|nr:hypothetical protein [Chlamydiota bacterium]